jgi:tetratricopeptide (TPR) repeat protein
MTPLNRILLVVIASEMVIGGIAAGLKLRAPSPPLADVSYLDPITGTDLRQLAINARSPEDWRKLGETYMARGFFRESEACHRVAAQREPANADAAQQWALSLERLGRLDEANAAYVQAATLDPAGAPACYFFIARNKLRQEDRAGARQALAAAGDLPAARYVVACLLLGEGRRDEAGAMLKELAREFPQAQQPWLMLHRIALAQQKPAEAAVAADRQDTASEQLPSPFDAEFQRIRKAHDEFGLQGLWGAARKMVEEGHAAAAELILRDALAARFNAYPTDWLAEALFQQGRIDEAVRLQQEIIERHGPSVEYLERLGDTLDAVGRQDDARAAWLRAARLSFGPPLRDVHGKLGESLAAAGQQQLANQQLALAAQAAGIGELRARHVDQAETALRQAVRVDPQLAHAWYYLGETARQRGEAEAARAAYERCLSIQPHHGRAADRLERLASPAVFSERDDPR